MPTIFHYENNLVQDRVTGNTTHKKKRPTANRVTVKTKMLLGQMCLGPRPSNTINSGLIWRCVAGKLYTTLSLAMQIDSLVFHLFYNFCVFFFSVVKDIE